MTLAFQLISTNGKKEKVKVVFLASPPCDHIQTYTHTVDLLLGR